MKTISFINLKGGVGKTTLSTNLAYLLAESWELKVLFIDNDKQGNASRWLGADPNQGTLANILMDGAKASKVVQSSRHGNLDFIAADMGLLEANLAVLGRKTQRQDVILKQAFEEIADQYAVCIIDNPPDINMSVFNALSITDDVVIVTLPETDSMDGIKKMAAQIEDVKQFNLYISIKGVLVNQYLSYPDLSDSYEDMKALGLPLFHTKISYATREAKYRLMTASKTGKSIFEVCPNCRVARDMMHFAEEMFA